MAGMVNGELSVIDNRDGERVTQSVVCFDKEGVKPVVGSNAILAAATAPQNFVYEVKRMFGKGFYNKDIQKSMPFWPFKVKEIKGAGASESTTDNIGIVVEEKGKEKVYEPIQVSACVLNYLIESAKVRLGTYPSFVVITVPAYFHEGAKQRTLDAAKIAFSGKTDENGKEMDIKVVLLAEPTAAAIAYGSIMIKNKVEKTKDEERILVFDLGGGTYDVSILDFSYDKENPVGIVKATDGDNYLGGSDFDNVIVKMATDLYTSKNPNQLQKEDQNTKIKNDLRLRQEAIKAKCSLSSNPKVTFNLNCYKGTDDLTFEITRTKFERACSELFDKLLEKVKGVLLSCEGTTPVYFDDGKLNVQETLRVNPNTKNLDKVIENAKKSIDKVVMVGGSSRIPKVKAIMEEFFNERADTPLSSKKVVSPLNPDEAIAYGAGYFANASCPDSVATDGPSLLLIDQVPLNLNIETYGGVATKIVEARTSIPCKQTQIFSTAADNQTSVEIVITQGNRPISSENYLIGKFTLSGIAPAPKGTPQIEVTFDVDQNNILKVTAVDKASGARKMYVENMTNKLSDSDIENMKKQAEEHSKQDHLFMSRIEGKNNFERLIYDFQDKLKQSALSEEKKAELRAIIDSEEKWLNECPKDIDPAEIQNRTNAFLEKMKEMIPSGGKPSGNEDVEEVN